MKFYKFVQKSTPGFKIYLDALVELDLGKPIDNWLKIVDIGDTYIKFSHCRLTKLLGTTKKKEMLRTFTVYFRDKYCPLHTRDQHEIYEIRKNPSKYQLSFASYHGVYCAVIIDA